ncbi:hypothetical protein GCM10010353_39070 [Streptomyces chryseus]|nr:hypothetical protein GCM10010353_39070 [Streptomyces chryseus]
MWNASTGSAKSGSASSTYAPSPASRSTAARTAAATSGRTATCPPKDAEYATRRPFTPPSRAAVMLPPGASWDQSRQSGPLMTSISSAASAASRVIGPTWASVPKGLEGYSGTRPYVGFSPKIPQNDAGMRTEPPPSVPSDSGPAPYATAAALPPLEPPAVRAGSYGLPVAPDSGESVTPFQPNSGVVVLPRNTAPCSRSRATEGASSSHRAAGRTVLEPRSVGPPRISSRSFTDTGTPSTSPCGSFSRHRSADASACARA